MNPVQKKVRILNITMDNMSEKELLDRLKHGGWVTTPNVDHYARIRADDVFDHIYHKADYLVCDSQILIFVAKLKGKTIIDKISGSDFLSSFYQYYANDTEMTMFLLGALEGVAAKAQGIINQKVGREMVTGVYSPPFGFERDPVECLRIVEAINQSGANVLVLGMGAPKQEKWFYRYRHLLKHVTIIFGFGATIDFEAGNKPRSPKWMSKVGLEWLYRLLQEPQRLWRRYLVDSLPFLGDLALSFMGQYKFRRPIGVLIQEAGFLTESQMVDLVDFREMRRSLSLGQILVAKGAIQPPVLKFFESIVPHLSAETAPSIVGLCEQAGLLTTEQRRSLETETDHSTPEVVALERGWLTPQVVRLLKVAIASGGLDLTPEAALYRAGLIDFDWIAAARAYQRNPAWLSLSELAVAQGFVPYEVVHFAQEHVLELSQLPHPQAVRDRFAAAGFIASANE
ncbi:MAG: glycosyltransferase [Oscillatoriales cyanobacterium]|nr:MAG: glycosyltransferase [Oscillatoriales cyanobacterium]